MRPKLAAFLAALVVLGVVAAVVLARALDGSPAVAPPAAVGSGSGAQGPITGTDGTGTPTTAADPAAYELARSAVREDSVYPNVGDPGVDALHYELELAWDADERVLDATAALTFRPTGTAHLRLDLADPLEVDSVTIDGADVPFQHNGNDLVVPAPPDDRVHVLAVAYHGTPEPTRAPTTRDDLDSLGWTVTPEGEVWTMQEPWGAFTWYPVHDHPSDKAYYDITVHAPSPMVGVANGRLVARSEEDGVTTTRWKLDAPAASYLVTLAIGDLALTRDRSPSGVPISYWTPRGEPGWVERLRFTPRALAWAERRLGPYPFETLGVLLVDARTGMETQTMITLGRNDYATSPEVLVHEVVHHWYGNLVTPVDWRDLWMNEGMTTYLQGQFEADRSGRDIDAVVEGWVLLEEVLRTDHGPPGAYDPRSFAEGNVYYGPALMWHELRERLGERRFWSMVRAWPRERAHGNAGRREYLAWVEQHTGEELSAFFDAWLLGERTPAR